MPERIQLTSEQRERLGSKLGLDPWGFDAIDDGEGSIEIVPVETEDRSAFNVMGRQAAAAVPSQVLGAAGAAAGAKLVPRALGAMRGAKLGKAGGLAGTIVGGVAGGIGLPIGVDSLTDVSEKVVMPLTGYEEPLQLERDLAEHPIAARVGSIGASIAGWSPRNTVEAALLLKGAGKLANLDRLSGFFQRGKKGVDPSALGLSTAEAAELTSEAISQPVGLALSAYEQSQSPEGIDPKLLALDAVGNLAFGGSRFTPKPRGLRALTPQPAAAEPSRPAAPATDRYTQPELPGMPRPDDAPPRADIEAVLQRRNELQELARNKAEDEFYTTASRQDDLPFDEAEILVREQRLKELEDASRTAAEGKETLSPDELAQARADEQAIIAGRYQKAGDPAQGVISDLEMLQRRGIPQRFVPEIVGPDGEHKAGAFTGDETLYSEKYIRESTPVHEGMHAETAQMRQSENPHDARVLAKMLAAADEEDIARAGEKYAGENSPFAGWVKDNWSYVKTRFGFGTPEDAARVLYSRLRNTSPEARPFQAESGKTPEYQDAFDFAPKREFNSDRPFGLTMANDGTLPTQNLLAKLDKSLNRGDRELLRFAGLDRYLESKDRVDVKELRQWIAENEPKVEVKELDAEFRERKQSIEQQQLERTIADLQHELDTRGYWVAVQDGVNLVYRNNEPYALRQDQVPAEIADLVTRYAQANEDWMRRYSVEAQGPENNDSATRRFEQVNPRELKDMPGAVDLLVRIPSKETDPRTGTFRPGAGVLYSSYHYPQSGDNLLTHVRAYEHELPDGRRVLRVFELQSDWAQSKGKQEEFIKKALKTFDESAKARLIDDPDRPGKKIWVVYPKGDDKLVFTKATNAEEALAEARANIKLRENASLTSQARINSHPLLDHTNRLGLKAAIEHARKRGLDGVVIDDADTVMLTEMHDRVQTRTMLPQDLEFVNPSLFDEHFGEDWRDGKYVEFRDRVYRVDKPESNRHSADAEIARELAPYWGTDRQYIPQRGGMELNYNKLLPAAMSDITGAAPQRVNLGEHKNAFEVRRERIPGTNTEPEDSPLDLSDVREIVEPRADLILKNQDGTPKTESTGLFFPLGKAGERRAAGEPFTLTGARYQPIETEPVPGSLFRAVYESNPEMGQRLQRFATTQNELQGMFNVRTLQNLVQIPREVREAAAAKRDMEYATGLPQTYTPDEQVYIDLLNDFNLYTRDVANNRGGARINQDPFYQPQMLSAEFMARIGQGTQQEIDAAINAVLPEYLLYNQRFAAGHYDPVEAENYLRRYLARVMNEQGGANVEFAALTRGARPYGLPPSLREIDPLRALERYANRWSRDVARHETIASNPAAAHFFGLTPDAQGNRAVMSTEVQAARKYLYGNLTPQAATNRTLANIPSAQRFVSAALIGPMTATRNILSTISQNATALSIPELLTVPMRYARLIGDWADTWQRAAQMNVVRPDNDRYTFGADVDIATRMGQNLQRAAGAMRRMTGTEFLETLDRLLTYSVGEGKFDLYRPLLDANDPDAQAFFRMYGAAVDTAEPIDMQRAKVAANYTRAIQTSYDAEDLPRLMLSNRGAAYGLRLQRWGVSNLNRLRERVFRPAREGNYLPLITYLGAVFGISVPLIEKFNEMVRGKDRRPTSKEIETVSEDPEIEKLLNVMELADTGSLFGILGTFAGATAENIRGGNRALVSEPLTTSTIDAAVGLGRLATALIEGEDPLKSTLMFMDEQVLRKIQALRPLLEQDEMREDKRNKAVLQSLAGDKATVEEVIINGLGIGRWSRLPKLSPAKKAVQKTGDREARKFLQSKGQSIRDLNNYPGGFEEPRKERALRAFIGETQGEEALEDYLTRRNAFKARVLGREE